ncbi:Regulator of telomere elongation helicase 1 [Heracleum sosnowskyi]|uniref:Regulator of telomere elongation helicase 1 homolog n=1 Tax=Heracleum sosnowskyi TaxID=360622 RepID=A0AAD8H0N4_9APIA|nr:Regulator of telomere elongation helicase 1 [Heracleum sosnowskyi]
MPTYKIRGLDVDFPFQAYDCQLVYMEKVIESLQNRCNALLESPTGTGKTLCLLCATLAWRKSLGGFSTGKSARRSQDMSSQSDAPKLPTIIYTSRTHSQLRQVIKELKRSNYRPKMVVLGSREQLCIHEEVSSLRGRAQTNACHSLCKKRQKRYCAHFPRVAEFMTNNPDLGEEPIDIEDLVNYGKTSGACPYYMSRDLHKVVDILFAPYNYLIDPGNRRSLTIEWNNSILIFDEAHNLEGLCADAASFDLSSALLTACISEAKNCVDLSVVRRDNSNDKSCNPDNFAILRALLLKLEKRISEIEINSKEAGFTKPGPYIYDLLADLNVTNKTSSMLIDIIEEAALLLEEDASATDKGVQNKTKGAVCRLESIGNILKLIFKDGGTAHANYYRVHVQEVQSSASESFGGKPSRTLSWWCFNPGIAMEEFSKLGVGSIILTSGTLSPMDSFAEELKLDFPIRLENPHVISDSQLWAGVVPVGPSGYSFNSSYRSRDSPEYKLELGNAIVNFARIVPDGLLIFFPSYYLLDQLIGYWKNTNNPNSTNSTIWERICKHKLPVIEPRQASLFPTAIDDYMAKLKDPSCSGSVFFAVCRGKVSEGLDFADHAGRAVVVLGMPFATLTDPKVRLKREFLDEKALAVPRRTGCKLLTGEEWYSQQAARAINQAVGRVIRHRHDYGAIIFCDERFSHTNRQSQISVWIQPHIKCYSKFGDVVFTLTRFFRDGKSRKSTLLQLSHTEDYLSFNENVKGQDSIKSGESVKRQDSIKSMDKLLNSFLAPVGTTKDPTYSESSSTLTDLKTQNFPDQVRVIPPANRCRDYMSTMRYSSNLFQTEKKYSVAGKRNLDKSEHVVVDLTDDEFQDDKRGKGIISSCSSKKTRLVKTEDHLCQHTNFQENQSSVSISLKCNPSVKQEKLENSEIMHNAQDGLSIAVTANRGNLQSSSHNNRGAISSSAPCDAEEKKGSTFLNQVKEKLTDAEYKDFVGFMRALKSKAEKASHVLQSIAKLFSAPDRLPLLQRFKDYVPAKYQHLYELYLE